jgi:hypothetical protein
VRKRYGEYVLEFLKSSPDGGVVNIGCGMDSCFSRINNGRVRFHDLDLWLRGLLKGIVNFKMRKELHLGKDATFYFGIRESREMGDGIRESLFLMTGLILILRKRSSSGSGLWGALNCSGRCNGRFITG